MSRTTPHISRHLEKLESTLRLQLIPRFTGRPPPCDDERVLFALPARLGSLGLRNPAESADEDFQSSRMVSDPLKELIWTKSSDYSYECHAAQLEAKSKIRELRKQSTKDVAKELRARLPESSRKAMDLASERGVSNWLTSLPIHEFGFCLHKSAFVDAISLRYGWHPSSTPTHCVCGSTFTVQHVLSCPRGGFPIIHHNELRDLTAHLLTEVCHDVRAEPDLQPLTGETLNLTSANSSDGARLDFAVNGFWGGRLNEHSLM